MAQRGGPRKIVATSQNHGDRVMKTLTAVRAEDLDGEPQMSAVDPGEGPNRGAAGSIERLERATLGGDHQGGGRVAQAREPGRASVRLAGLDGEGALAGRGRRAFGIDHLADLAAQTQADQPRRGQDDGVRLATVELGQARVDIAAQRQDFEVWPRPQRLGLAAQAGGAQARALGKIGETGKAAADEGVARVLALGAWRRW